MQWNTQDDTKVCEKFQPRELAGLFSVRLFLVRLDALERLESQLKTEDWDTVQGECII